MAKPMAPEEFIRRAKTVHGTDYDYSCTEYRNMQHKVRILCPKHGEFSQMPQAHLRGQGCPVCGKEKYRQVMLAKYGEDNPMKVRAIFEKARATSVKRYGHEWALSNPEIQEKRIATSRKIYGGASPMCSAEVRARTSVTLQKRYGVVSMGQSSEFRAKARRTCRVRYGSDEPLAAESVRQKIRQTNLERYGGPAPMSSSEIREKTMVTCMRRYGVPYVTQTAGVVEKTQQSKAENGTFGTSSPEEVIYTRLCGVFGEDDVVRQYKSDAYPFACDFYIKSRDMYIEVNASWTHGRHWYGSGHETDVDTVQLWSRRGTKYYRNAVHVWTEADVIKRETARRNDLNYIVFWDGLGKDAPAWFEAGCPDGRDWDMEYSWRRK